VRIVVNHLTRMRGGYICVAGIDPDTGRHVRPMAEDDNLRRPDLVGWKGVFDMASIVDLGRTSYVGKAPELEDHRFRPRNARRDGDLAPDAFWAMLEKAAQPRLRDIFGDDLYRHGSSFVVDVGKGRASLGCLRLARPPFLHVSTQGGIRLSFNDQPDTPMLKVTDLRLYDFTSGRPRDDLVADLRRRMSQGVGVILSVGLTRPWQKTDEEVERHWLQVNNIHLQDNPVWTERS